MVKKRCAIKLCHEFNNKKPNTKYYRFPSSEEQTEKYEFWKRFAGLSDDHIKTVFLCERHFLPANILSNRLRKNAVPEFYFGYDQKQHQFKKHPIILLPEEKKQQEEENLVISKICRPLSVFINEENMIEKKCILVKCNKTSYTHVSINFIKFSSKNSKILLNLSEEHKMEMDVTDDKLYICENHLTDFLSFPKSKNNNSSNHISNNNTSTELNYNPPVNKFIVKKRKKDSLLYTWKYVVMFHRNRKNEKKLKFYNNLRKKILRLSKRSFRKYNLDENNDEIQKMISVDNNENNLKLLKNPFSKHRLKNKNNDHHENYDENIEINSKEFQYDLITLIKPNLTQYDIQDENEIDIEMDNKNFQCNLMKLINPVYKYDYVTSSNYNLNNEKYGYQIQSNFKIDDEEKYGYQAENKQISDKYDRTRNIEMDIDEYQQNIFC